MLWAKDQQIVGLKKTIKKIDFGPAVNMNKDTIDKVRYAVRNDKFRTVKFIGDETQLFEVTEDILESFQWDDYTFFEEEENETKEEKAQWDEYVSDCDAAEAVAYEQQCERLHFSFN